MSEEPVRRCEACCEILVRRYRESPSPFKKRKFCSVKCAAKLAGIRNTRKKAVKD